VFPPTTLPVEDNDARHIVERFLVYPPEERLRVSDALKDEWFADRVQTGELEAMMSELQLPVKNFEG